METSAGIQGHIHGHNGTRTYRATGNTLIYVRSKGQRYGSGSSQESHGYETLHRKLGRQNIQRQ